MKESQVKEQVRKGWIRAIITFEVVGTPKAHVESSLKEYMANIHKDDRITFVREEFEPAVQHDDGMFSTFCEAELLAKNLETFTWLCINFSPASIEILEPDEIVTDARDLTNWLNDLLAMVHDVGTKHRAVKAGNDHLTLAMNQLIKNSILLAVKQGPKDAKEISRSIGVDHIQLEPFLNHMAQKKELAKEKDKYLVPPIKITKSKK
jgi:hypothetical protein